MDLSRRGVVFGGLAAALCGALAPATSGAVQGISFEGGGLKVNVLAVKRAPRLVGDLPRSRENTYLVLALNVRSASEKPVLVHPRAGFAILGGKTGPATAKYPVFLIGYFDPDSARPTGSQEAIRVNDLGVTFSIAAEVPRSETEFRLAVQQPVAEAGLGKPRAFNQPLPVKPLEPGTWEGQVTSGTSQGTMPRAIPGSPRLDTLKPRRDALFDYTIELKNAGKEPREVTVADLVLATPEEGSELLAASLGAVPEGRKQAAPVPEGKPVAPQAAAPPLRPVWDLARAQEYTLRVYGVAGSVPLPAAQPSGEITVDTAEGLLVAGAEHQSVGRLDPALATYRRVIEKWPRSAAAEEAQGRIADIEVGRIRGARFIALPPPQQAGRANLPATAVDQAQLSVSNSTGLPLTLFVSGPSSKTVQVRVGETQVVKVTRGRYQVGARVPSPTINPFFGEWDIAPGVLYLNDFIIVKREGGN